MSQAPVFPFELRCVQLDLARQKENTGFIRQFIDFAAEYGYNALLFYLEGRIRTRSFPWPAPAEGYDPKDIAELVAYAAAKDMQVIPAVSTLGHVEQFLRHHSLEHLAELREGHCGRFSNAKMVFCPSLSETYDFLRAYLSEVCALFPSRYLHIGCDEVWDIGFCSLCRKRLREGETQSGIFARHLRDIHGIVAGELGKQPILWDDMFEPYPDALADLPRDFVMCCWHYDRCVTTPRSHFLNRRREDSLSRYRKLGFPFLIAPREQTPRNTETLTAYAVPHRPLGGLMTVWEKSRLFLYEHYPNIAYAGRLWTHGPGADPFTLYEDVLGEVAGIQDRDTLRALRLFIDAGAGPEPSDPRRLLSGPLNDAEHARDQVCRLLQGRLSTPGGAAPETRAGHVRQDLELAVRREALHHRLRRLLPPFLDPRTARPGRAELARQVRAAAGEADAIAAVRETQWQTHRAGIAPNHAQAHYVRLRDEIRRLADEPPPAALLNVILMLPDVHSAQRISFCLQYEPEGPWQEIAQGVFKPPDLDRAFYEYAYPCRRHEVPLALRVESWGYGGQGLVFAEVVCRNRRLVPTAIRRVNGTVLDPQHVLDDDLKWTFLGNKDTYRSFLEPELANSRHGMELTLSPAMD